MRKPAVALLVLAGALVSVFAWWQTATSPVNGSDSSKHNFVIASGDGVREIAKNLKDQGLIRDQVAFFVLVRVRGLDKKIQAGTYSLSPSLTSEQLANELLVGKEDVTITVLEGWRSEEIKEYLAQNLPAVAADPMFAQTSWKEYEGKLFPDTYFVSKETGASEILGLMLANYAQKINFPLTANQLTVASMIEREAKYAKDRPIIASIIYNRLAAGMTLDVDATVQYALGRSGSWWKKELTTDDLKVKSPYNTYLNPGLPPTPISNPGLSAIQAAISPARTDYLFYLTGKDGQMHYAKTLDEHNANVAKYL